MDCKKVIVMPQIGSTCWANAIFMSTLYSQSMRGLLINKLTKGMQNQEMTSELHTILLDILQRRFKTSDELKSYAYMYFQVITPEVILKKLHEYNKQTFNFDPIAKQGYFNYLYLPKFLDFLGAKDVAMVDFVNGMLYHSIVNGGLEIKTAQKGYHMVKNEGKITKSDKREYDAIIVYCTQNKSTKHLFDKKKFQLKETYVHNGKTYILDSLLLTNFNTDQCKKGHDICGITCGGERYLYNGWISKTRDPAMSMKHLKTTNAFPCELMSYDWLKEEGDFCLNPALCKLDKSKDFKKELCFNVGKGDRIYIYVNKQRSMYAPPPTPVTPTTEFTPILPKPKAPKECPPGKVINPETNRCNKVKPTKTKECPPGKVLNPKTNRCKKAT